MKALKSGALKSGALKSRALEEKVLDSKPPQLSRDHRQRWINDPVCLAATLTSLAMSMAALMAPPVWLWWVAGLAVPMLVLGSRQASPMPLLKLFLWQCVITCSIYAVLWGSSRLDEALLVSFRLVLAFVPPWFLAVRFAPERLGGLFATALPPRWAFVLTASLNALPFLLQEAREIYRIQRLRGARIAPKELLSPGNWGELINTVIAPLLLELFKLSQRQALAAKSRRFGEHPRPTQWPRQGERDEN